LVGAIWPLASARADEPPPPMEVVYPYPFDISSCGSWNGGEYANGSVLIRLTPSAIARLKSDPTPTDTGIPELDRVNNDLGVTSFAPLGYPWYAVTFDPNIPVACAMNQYGALPAVIERAEPNYIVHTTVDVPSPDYSPGADVPLPSQPRVEPGKEEGASSPSSTAPKVGVGASPPASTAPETGLDARSGTAAPARISRRRARLEATKALKRRYGRSYRRATRKRLRCTHTTTQYRCTFSFQKGSDKRRGLITGSTTASGSKTKVSEFGAFVSTG
jgi:hypothetical protein